MAVVATLSKGYDLEYIWAQVDRGPVKDAASYYIQASENGGEPARTWPSWRTHWPAVRRTHMARGRGQGCAWIRPQPHCRC